MKKNNKDSWKLDREMYKKSTKIIKEKAKKMFDLFNKVVISTRMPYFTT